MHKIFRVIATVLICALRVAPAGATEQTPEPWPKWAGAENKPAMTVDEARAFIGRLHEYVKDHHLKTKDSPQRGMLYEYFWVKNQGKPNQWVQGEGLDTMHDGAWYAAAMVNAYRATGDAKYRDFLAEYQVPFYCKMLNHSDTLFSAKQDDSPANIHKFDREHMLQEGELGFVPYWWDDGSSVSLERIRNKNNLAVAQARDLLAHEPNPQGFLSGYSLGSSNHMAQDLGVMVEQCWLLFREQKDERAVKLTADLAEAAVNLHKCRVRHSGDIPMTLAPAALVQADAKMMARVPSPHALTNYEPNDHYSRALKSAKPGERMPLPGFADDEEYRYYHGVAFAGGHLPDPLAFRVIYEAFTEPMLFRMYCDDAPLPAGVNKFDLHPMSVIDGKPADYRSDRKGPFQKMRPVGSRMGPQNMVACGWALEALKGNPGLWDRAVELRRQKNTEKGKVDYVVHTKGDNEGRGAGILTRPFLIRLGSSADSLRLTVERPYHPFDFRVFSDSDGHGTFAALHIDQAVSIKNNFGDDLLFKVRQRVVKDEIAFDIELPYTHVKGQKPWANAMEFGVMSLAADGFEPANFLTVSSEKTVVAALQRELGQGLRTWEAIFDQYGYIPTGINAGGGWDEYSDTGGYAHLISAASQWILYLEGKSDWTLQHVPPVLEHPENRK